jgi:putative ABC transport system permease protein
MISIVTGVLLILVPHFILPLSFLKGRIGALIVVDCSAWYHPELYLGILAVAGGIFSLKYRKAVYMTAIIGILGVIQGFLLKPVSFYLRSEIPVLTLSHTLSIRAHQNIGTVILVLSSVLLASSLLRLVIKKRRTLPDLTPFYISATNLKMTRSRSSAIVIALTIVIGAFFSDILLIRSIGSVLEIGSGRLGADLVVVPEGKEEEAEAFLYKGKMASFYMGKEVLDSLRNIPGIERISEHLYIKPAVYRIAGTMVEETVMIIAYDPEMDFTVAPWIKYSLGGVQGPDDLVVGWSVKYYPGQKVSFLGKELTVATTLDPTGLGYYDNSAFIPIESARSLLKEFIKNVDVKAAKRRKKVQEMALEEFLEELEEYEFSIKDIDPEGISAIFIKGGKGVSIKDLSERIRETVKGVSVVDVKESTVSIKRSLSSIAEVLMLPIIILLVMGTIILGIVYSMSVNERQREIGLLRAMGARKGSIFKIIIMESLMLSVTGGVFGILFGGSLLVLFKNRIMAALELLYIWPSAMVILTVMFLTTIVSIAIGMLAGLFPAVRASRMEPYHAIRTGGK